MSLPQERSTAELVFYTWVARSRSGSSSFTASALNDLAALEEEEEEKEEEEGLFKADAVN